MSRTESFIVETEGFDAMLAIVNPKLFERTVRTVARKTGSNAKTQIAKAITARYNLTSARIKKDIEPAKLTADGISMVLKRRPAPTIGAYGGVFNPSGGRTSASIGGSGSGATSWKIFRQGGKTTSANVFWRRAKSGKMLPFVSSSSGLPGPFYPKGSPHGIRVMYGPTVGSVFAGDSRYGDEIRVKVGSQTQLAFTKNVEAEMARIARGF